MWKKIILEETTTNYSVSKIGEVRNDTTLLILKQRIQQGYNHVSIRVNNKSKSCRVHRLVAMAYVPNSDPENKVYVNHIDGVRSNNYYLNLEWVTPSENSRHAFQQGLRSPNRKKGVLCYDLDGEKIFEFPSISEAARQTDSLVEKIIACCQYKRKTHNLMQWRYKEDEVSKLSSVEKPKTLSRKVAQLDSNDEVIAVYDSVSQAAKAVQGSSGAICNILNKKKQTKTHRGYGWKVVEEDEG